jgi:ethanolamine utilization protein EutQ (cupin superfamily)
LKNRPLTPDVTVEALDALALKVRLQSVRYLNAIAMVKELVAVQEQHQQGNGEMRQHDPTAVTLALDATETMHVLNGDEATG